MSTPQQPPLTQNAALEGDDENVFIDLRGLLAILSRRRAWVILTTLIGFSVGVLYTIQAPRIYESAATIVIDDAPPDVLSGVQQVYSLGSQGYWGLQTYYKTQYRVISSRPVLNRAAQALGLEKASLKEQIEQHIKLAEDSRDQRSNGFFAAFPQALQQKLTMLGLHTVDDADRLLEILANMDIPQVLRGRIDVHPVEESQLVEIRVRSVDSAAAAMLSNAVVDSYIDFNLLQSLSASQSAGSWLSDQTLDLKQRLTASEQALHDFKKENNVVSVSMEDRQTMTSETLSELNRSLSGARAERIAMEGRWQQIQEILAGKRPPESLVEVRDNGLIQELKRVHSNLRQERTELASRYTEEHPKLLSLNKKIALVEREIDAEVKKTLESLSAQYQSMLQTEKGLHRAIDEIKKEALDLNQKEIQYGRLKRERDTNLVLHDLVIKREKETDLTQLLKVNNIRKLEEAQASPIPILPKVQLNLVVALFGALALGLFLAFAAHFFDNTIKSQEQVQMQLGLPFVGIIPQIHEKDLDIQSRDQYIIHNPRSSLAESCRTIRTNVLFMAPGQDLARILVTSSGPREGKTCCVVNLSVTMAQAGARVLMIDTDMRRPRLHRTFGTSNDVGISSLIIGAATPDEAIKKTTVANLDILPCGPVPPNPAELLHTEQFKELVDSLAARYDRLIFDSPPSGGLADG
ncbi:MAG: polysaccharide biosynthesis tyrosine autokinase, partial [Myxococcota bacterium]